MDEAGVEIMIASLNAPAIQAIHDVEHARSRSRARPTTCWRRRSRRRPDRFVGVAALPMQDPEIATAELQRCIKELGFKGALVNGYSQVGTPDTAVHYDLPQYRPFWHAVESLDVPFYLHPRPPLPGDVAAYEGHHWLFGPNWASPPRPPCMRCV